MAANIAPIGALLISLPLREKVGSQSLLTPTHGIPTNSHSAATTRTLQDVPLAPLYLKAAQFRSKAVGGNVITWDRGAIHTNSIVPLMVSESSSTMELLMVVHWIQREKLSRGQLLSPSNVRRDKKWEL